MTAEQALEHLARQTAEAVAGALVAATGREDGAEPGAVTVLERGAEPLAGLPAPGVAVEVGYVEGVTGGNVLCLTQAAARRLAQAMMGADAEAEPGSEPLEELELSAVGETANQAMAAAAQATSLVLEQEIEISPPRTRAFDRAEGAVEVADSSAHVTVTALTVLGEPARLVQIVPTAFTVRMTRALDDREIAFDPPAADGDAPPAGPGFAATLSDARVRVSAELGRRRMPAGEAVAIPEGAIVELDRAPDDPIDIYVNGRRLALGRLVITDGGRWAVRVEQVLDRGGNDPDTQPGVR